MRTDPKVWDWRTYIIKHGPDNPTYRHVLLTLSCYMDSAGGSCFPSIKELKKATKLGKTTVIKYLEKASQDGWIIKGVHGFSGQGWKRNEYTAQVPEKVVHEMNRVAKGGSPDGEGGSAGEPKVVQQVNTNSPYTSTSNSPKSARENSGKSSNSSDYAKTPSIMDQIDGAETTRQLVEIYRAYRKEMGVWDNTYTMDAQQHQFDQLGLSRAKAALKNSITNGWKKLVEPDGSGEDEEFDATGIANAGAYEEYEEH